MKHNKEAANQTYRKPIKTQYVFNINGEVFTTTSVKQIHDKPKLNPIPFRWTAL